MTENEEIEWLKAISAVQKESIHTSSLLNRKEALHIAIQALEEIQQYRAIGTLEELQSLKEHMGARDLKRYLEIGTIEECREAVEKQKEKIPYFSGDGYWNGKLVYDTWTCPNCSMSYDLEFEEHDHCPNCGQHIKWLEHEE